MAPGRRGGSSRGGRPGGGPGGNLRDAGKYLQRISNFLQECNLNINEIVIIISPPPLLRLYKSQSVYVITLYQGDGVVDQEAGPAGAS